MAEEAGDEMLLSYSVPNCRNDARNEIIYADMIRISTDCDGGGWWFISDKERGQVNESGQGDKYRSAFDGLIGWADIIGVKGQTIMDRFCSTQHIGKRCRKRVSYLNVAG